MSQATTRVLPTTYSHRKLLGWVAQWRIIIIMVTQWGQVMENVPCEAGFHGSFTLENKNKNSLALYK